MIHTLRRYLAGFLAALGLSLPAAAATSGTTDFTDIWGLPTEPGWGLTIIHQNSMIFATLFVYDANGQPHWFSASETAGSGSSFSGPLYEHRGTSFTAPYNPANHNFNQVGTISFNFSSANTGTLTYTVANVPVTKAIQRFAFRNENLSGNYLGGMTARSVCTNGTQNSLIFDTMTVNHSGSSITFTVRFFNAQGTDSTCVFNGSYSQNGSLGHVSNGTFSCTYGSAPGNQGSFTISNIDAQATGFNGTFTGSDQFCSSHTGYFGGVRDVPLI